MVPLLSTELGQHRIIDSADLGASPRKKVGHRIVGSKPLAGHEATRTCRKMDSDFAFSFPCTEARSSRGPSAAESPSSSGGAALVLATTGVSSERARDHLDTTTIGKTSHDGKARDAIIDDGVHEAAVAIRAYRRAGYGKRIGAAGSFPGRPPHTYRDKARSSGLGRSISVRIVRVSRDRDFGRSGLPLPNERLTVEARRLDDGRIADVKVRYVVLRNVANTRIVSIRCTVKSDPADGVVPRGNCRGLDQIAPVHLAPPPPTPIERRHDLRIGEQVLIFSTVGRRRRST